MLTEAQKTEMRANIARGIKYLDRTIPDWRSQINWDEFRFESTADCIWGQLTDKVLGFRMRFTNPKAHMGWGVPIQIHRDTNSDNEREFTYDENPADICPYHFMHHEWSRQNPAKYAIIGHDGWKSPDDPPDTDRRVQVAWDDMSFGNSHGFYESKSIDPDGRKYWWGYPVHEIPDGHVGAWRELPTE